MAIADRIVVMNAGRIEDQGTPARVYTQPASLFAADFMGEMNHIPARSDASGLDTPFGRLAPRPGRSGDGVACIRPEALMLEGGAVDLGSAVVRDAAFFGSYVRVHLVPDAAPDLALVAHLPPGDVPAPGTALHLGTHENAFHFFPKGD